MSYCGIMRVEKRKMQAAGGIQQENNRNKENQKEFVASDINWERTQDNIFLQQSNNLQKDIKKELHDHGIDKWRKDAVTFIDGFYGASPEFFEGKSKEEIQKYFEDCLQFHKDTYGNHVINAVIHLDEATPHMHVISVPIVEIKEFNEELGVPEPPRYKLSAKELMGNIKAYTERQDRFFEEVSKQYGLERGEKQADREEKREHLSVLDFKTQEVSKTLEQTIEAVELNKEAAAKIQNKIAEKESKVNSLDKSIEARESRLTALDGEIKAAKDLKKEKSDKGLFGRVKDEITIPYTEYRNLQKTARKVEDVREQEARLNFRERDFNQKVDDIQPTIDEANDKREEAEKQLQQAREYKENLEDYIRGTAHNIANKKVDDFINSLGESKDLDKLKFLEQRLQDFDIGGKSLAKVLDKEYEEHIAEIERSARSWGFER